MARPQVIEISELAPNQHAHFLSSRLSRSEEGSGEEDETQVASSQLQLKLSGPVVVDLPVTANGKVINVGLQFTSADVSVRMLDRRPQLCAEDERGRDGANTGSDEPHSSRIRCAEVCAVRSASCGAAPVAPNR